MIAIRSHDELQRIREAGGIVAEALERVRQALVPGVSTLELDQLVKDVVVGRGGTLLFYKYRGFPANSCISINEEVVHGIPSARRKLKDGDIVSVDVGVRYRGYCGDSAWTFAVGNVSDETARLLRVGEEALHRGIEACRPGARLSEIGRSIQDYAEDQGLHVVKKYVGHGIGTKLHEDPPVPNYVDAKTLRQDRILRSGMVLAIEPMVNVGTDEVRTLSDGWTVVTADRSLSVHFEHTVAITDERPWIMTDRDLR